MAISKNFTVGAECSLSWTGTSMVAKSESVGATYTYDDPGEQGLIGTREPSKGRRNITKIDVRGSFVVAGNYSEAACLLKSFFAKASSYSDGTFSGYTARELPDTPATNNLYTLLVDRNHATGKVFSYPTCWPEKLTVRWSENNPVEFEMSVMGATEGTATSTISAAGTASPAIADDVTLLIDTMEYYCKGGEITIDMQFDERFHNSLTRTHAQPKVLKVTGQVDIDLNSDTWAVFQANTGETQSMAIKLKIDDGTNGVGLVLPQACVTSKTPTITGGDVISAQLEFQGYSSDSGAGASPTVVAFFK